MVNKSKTLSNFLTDTKETVTLSNGDFIELNKMTLRRVLSSSIILSELVTEIKLKYPEVVTNLFDIKTGTIHSDYIPTLINELPILIPGVFPTVLNKLADLSVIFTNVDKNIILDEWTMEDLVEVSKPFFGYILKSLNQVMMNMVGKTEEKLETPLQ